MVFFEQGDPKPLLVEAVMAAILIIRHNALLRTAWASSDYPQAKLILSDSTRCALSLQGVGAAIGCRLLKEDVSHDSRG